MHCTQISRTTNRYGIRTCGTSSLTIRAVCPSALNVAFPVKVASKIWAADFSVLSTTSRLKIFASLKICRQTFSHLIFISNMKSLFKPCLEKVSNFLEKCLKVHLKLFFCFPQMNLNFLLKSFYCQIYFNLNFQLIFNVLKNI